MELVNKCKTCQNETLWTILIDHIEQAGVFRTVVVASTITIVLGIFAFAVSYGELKGQVKSISEQVNRIERDAQYRGKVVDAKQEGTKR
jgi:hypothetical protein